MVLNLSSEEICLEELVDYAIDSLDLKRSINIKIEKSLKENSICGDFYWLAEALINIIKMLIIDPLVIKSQFHLIKILSIQA